MRIYTAMDAFTLNGLLIVSDWMGHLFMDKWIGLGGRCRGGRCFGHAPECNDGLDMWAVTSFSRTWGNVEGMRTIAQPLNLVDTADAKPLASATPKFALRTCPITTAN